MWIWPFVVGGAALSACVYTAMHDPNVEQGIFPPCPFKTFTGYDCPGCGMTRGVYALMQGNVIKMLNHNLLLLLLLPTVGYGFLRWSLASFGSDRLPKISVTPKVSYGVVLFIVAFWIVRNLPGPLSFLNATA